MMSAPDAATAVGFGDSPAPRQLRLISWNHVSKGQLRGWATVEITSIGLRIVDVPVLIGRDGPWATLPEKPALDRDGKRKLDINGKPEWATVVEWKSRAAPGIFRRGRRRGAPGPSRRSRLPR